MKMLWIYLSIAIVPILILSGVGAFLIFKKEPRSEKEKPGVTVTILKRDTLRIAETIYGEVNVSYVLYREDDGTSSTQRYNLTANIQYPSEDIYYLGTDYRSIGVDGKVKVAGTGKMERIENGSYFVTMAYRNEVHDIWIEIYEKGVQLWDEQNKTYYYRGFRTEIIPVIMTDRYDTREMEENIVISDIGFGFDEDSMNRFNITFHISSSTDPKAITINYDMDLKSQRHPAFREIRYGSVGYGNHYASFDISDTEKEDLRFLYFNIGASNSEQMRVASPVTAIPFT